MGRRSAQASIAGSTRPTKRLTGAVWGSVETQKPNSIKLPTAAYRIRDEELFLYPATKYPPRCFPESLAISRRLQQQVEEYPDDNYIGYAVKSTRFISAKASPHPSPV